MPHDNSADAVHERARNFTYLDPALTIDNIFEVFADFRTHCPVVKSNAIEGGTYLVAQHADVDRVLKDHTTFINGKGMPPNSGNPLFVPNHYDPPEHREYRRDLNVLFSAAKVRQQEAAMAERVREYIAPIIERGRGELVKELTTPFPCVTFLLMLGAPLSDLDMLIDAKDVINFAHWDPEARERLNKEVFPSLVAYFNRLLDERVAAENPPDDLLTSLTRARVGDRPYTRDEMILTCTFLVLAGLDTVTVTWSKMLRYLAENPDHRRQLVENPEIRPEALEELLRYFAIVTLPRYVAKDTELGGVSLHEGDIVELLVPSAGRDECAYANADTVDFGRGRVTHLSFGAGVHRCLGSHLARMELKVGMEAVLEMMPDFHLDPEHPPREYLGNMFGVEELRIIVGNPS